MTPNTIDATNETSATIKMSRSQDVGKLASAMAKAQGQIKPAKKDSSNPFFKSNYADLASVWEAVREPLSSNGLAVIQTPLETDGAVVKLETMLVHESGEWITGVLTMKPKDSTPQGIGSCLTYARRYSLQAMTGVAPDDDDGEAAQGRPQQPVKREVVAAVQRVSKATSINGVQDNSIKASQSAFRAAADSLSDRDLGKYPLGEAEYKSIGNQSVTLSGLKDSAAITAWLIAEARLVSVTQDDGTVVIEVQKKGQ